MKLSTLVGVGLVAMMAAACGNMGNTPAASPQSTTTLTSAPEYPSSLRVDTTDPWAAPQPAPQPGLKLDTGDPWAQEPAPVAPATVGQPDPAAQPAPAPQPMPDTAPKP